MSTPPARFHGLNDDDTATHRTVTDSGVFDAVMDEAAADLAQGTTRTLRRDKPADPVPPAWKRWGLCILVGGLAGFAFFLMCVGAFALIGKALGWDGLPR